VVLCEPVVEARVDKAARILTAYVALLRAVNVGGTGKLPMSRLVEFCNAAGFAQAQTYIASGNAIFRSASSERDVREALQDRLCAYSGKPVGVLVRPADEMAKTVAANPFAAKPGNRVMVLFTDEPLPAHPFEGAAGAKDEEVFSVHASCTCSFPKGQVFRGCVCRRSGAARRAT